MQTATTNQTTTVRLPAKVLDTLDDTSWGVGDNETQTSHETRAAMIDAPRRKCGKGAQLLVELDGAHCAEAAVSFTMRADAMDCGVHDMFGDVRYGGSLADARSAQAEARVVRTAGERFAAAAKLLGVDDVEPPPLAARPVVEYRWQCPRGHRTNNTRDNDKPPGVCPSCGWLPEDDGGHWADIVTCMMGGEHVHRTYFDDVHAEALDRADRPLFADR